MITRAILAVLLITPLVAQGEIIVDASGEGGSLVMTDTNGGRKTSTEMNIRENFVFDEPFKARVV